MSLFWNIFLYWIHNANNFWSSLIWGHNITIKILWRSCLCALRALGWGIQILWCQIVRFSLWCQIVRFYMAVPNCPFLHDSAKLSAVPNCPFYMTVPNCPGAKLSVFIILVPNCPVPHCPTIISHYFHKIHQITLTPVHCKVWKRKSDKCQHCQILTQSRGSFMSFN